MIFRLRLDDVKHGLQVSITDSTAAAEHFTLPVMPPTNLYTACHAPHGQPSSPSAATARRATGTSTNSQSECYDLCNDQQTCAATS